VIVCRQTLGTPWKETKVCPFGYQTMSDPMPRAAAVRRTTTVSDSDSASSDEAAADDKLLFEEPVPQRAVLKKAALIVAMLCVIGGSALYTVYDISRIPRCACELRSSARVLSGERNANGDRSAVTMQGLLTTLTHAVEGAPAVAIAAAVVWGILSIILSPCHLASIPLIVGFIDNQGRMSTKRAFVISFLFASGILVTIGLIGAITAAAGRMMGDVGRYGNYFVAIIFFLVGLHLLDVIPMPWSGPSQVGMKRKGLLAALTLGLVFGVALGPCTFAYMAPMLGVTFKLAATNPFYGAILLLAYGVGHCSVIVAAGTSTELVQRFMNWNENSRGTTLVKKICGVLVLLGGIWMIYTAP